ncbi:MAG: hypothetical protein K6U74_21640, partial [Firmicutes bacterium]|nr:hypothetical protein [Bacillota bacterium]
PTPGIVSNSSSSCSKGRMRSSISLSNWAMAGKKGVEKGAGSDILLLKLKPESTQWNIGYENKLIMPE